MEFFNKRLDLSEKEYTSLIKCIDFMKLEELVNIQNNDLKDSAFDYTNESLNKVIDKLNNPKLIEYSFKKHTASEKATKVRTDKAKSKMQIAIEILQTQKSKITPYAIAKISGTSFTTVKKYFNEETLNSLNEIK